MNRKHKVIAIILAGGIGDRIKAGIPKQYIELSGKTILRRSVEAFQHHPGVDMVQVVINPEYRDLYEKSVNGMELPEPVTGGAARQDSVRLGLEGIGRYNPDFVLIHDAARAFIDPDTISRVIEALGEHRAVLPVIPVVNTTKQLQYDGKVRTIDRQTLRIAQTPQGYKYNYILGVHQRNKDGSFTDDSSIVEGDGGEVFLVKGDYNNVKVTTSADLEWAKYMTSERKETRAGIGYDVHAFEAGDVVRICGVDIPHDRSLRGHSDADVGIHAIVDAILGALGEGDIGRHFPADDDKWKNADSSVFLDYCKRLLLEKSSAIVNIDIIIICEEPKIEPHKGAMAGRIAEILEIDTGRVNVKATTNEKLGSLGRGEGIATQAIVTVEC